MEGTAQIISGLSTLNQFGAHEIASEAFRDTLARTVESLSRTINTQAVEIKNLRGDLDNLKSKNGKTSLKEQDRQAFKWLVEQVSDDEDFKDPLFLIQKKRKRSVGAKGSSIWISDEEFEDDFEDDDGALTDDLSSGANRNSSNSRNRRGAGRRDPPAMRLSQPGVMMKEDPSAHGLRAPALLHPSAIHVAGGGPQGPPMAVMLKAGGPGGQAAAAAGGGARMSHHPHMVHVQHHPGAAAALAGIPLTALSQHHMHHQHIAAAAAAAGIPFALQGGGGGVSGGIPQGYKAMQGMMPVMGSIQMVHFQHPPSPHTAAHQQAQQPQAPPPPR